MTEGVVLSSSWQHINRDLAFLLEFFLCKLNLGIFNKLMIDYTQVVQNGIVYDTFSDRRRKRHLYARKRIVSIHIHGRSNTAS